MSITFMEKGLHINLSITEGRNSLLPRTSHSLVIRGIKWVQNILTDVLSIRQCDISPLLSQKRNAAEAFSQRPIRTMKSV